MTDLVSHNTLPQVRDLDRLTQDGPAFGTVALAHEVTERRMPTDVLQIETMSPEAAGLNRALTIHAKGIASRLADYTEAVAYERGVPVHRMYYVNGITDRQLGTTGSYKVIETNAAALISGLVDYKKEATIQHAYGQPTAESQRHGRHRTEVPTVASVSPDDRRAVVTEFVTDPDFTEARYKEKLHEFLEFMKDGQTYGGNSIDDLQRRVGPVVARSFMKDTAQLLFTDTPPQVMQAVLLQRYAHVATAHSAAS